MQTQIRWQEPGREISKTRKALQRQQKLKFQRILDAFPMAGSNDYSHNERVDGCCRLGASSGALAEEAAIGLQTP